MNKVGRNKKYENGCIEHYKINKYHLEYYNKNKKPFQCPYCMSSTNLFSINQHLKRRYCKIYQELKPNIDIYKLIRDKKQETND